ncbi:MAG TPA: hypothetical protein VIM34_20935, partial [Burkholderiaceae bacterium]
MCRQTGLAPMRNPPQAAVQSHASRAGYGPSEQVQTNSASSAGMSPGTPGEASARAPPSSAR